MKHLYIIPLLFILGCATTQTLEVSRRSMIYHTDYIATLKGAVDYCTEDGFAILSVDKDLGILNTDFKETGGLVKILGGGWRWKINLSFIELADTITKVISIISTEKQGSFGRWEQATMTGDRAEEFYTDVFRGIQAHLDDVSMQGVAAQSTGSSPGNELARSTTGFSFDKSGRIAKVVKDSPADSAGVRVDDTIVEVNDEVFPKGDIKAALDLIEATGRNWTRLIIRRGDYKSQIEIRRQ